MCCMLYFLPHIHFCMLSNCFSFDNLFILDLWLCIPFRRVVQNSSSWIWYWKKLVQRPVLCLLAAALTNEEWSVWPFICGKANVSLFSIYLIRAPVLLQIWRMSLHYLFQWHLSYSMNRCCALLWIVPSGDLQKAIGELSAMLASVSTECAEYSSFSRAGGYNRGELGGWLLGEFSQAFQCDCTKVCNIVMLSFC